MVMFNMDRGWKSIGHAGHRHDHGRRSVVVETLLVPLRVATDRQDVFFNAAGWWWPQWCLHGPWVSQIWVLYWTCGDAFGKKKMLLWLVIGSSPGRWILLRVPQVRCYLLYGWLPGSFIAPLRDPMPRFRPAPRESRQFRRFRVSAPRFNPEIGPHHAPSSNFLVVMADFAFHCRKT